MQLKSAREKLGDFIEKIGRNKTFHRGNRNYTTWLEPGDYISRSNEVIDDSRDQPRLLKHCNMIPILSSLWR